LLSSPDRRISLLQGEVYCSIDPAIVTTVLGSCVAVCLWDQKRHTGGMNHFVLPIDTSGQHNARYGDVAIEQLLTGLARLGCATSDLQAKVFGGAAVLPFNGGQSIGSSNVLQALRYLDDYRIPISARRTGGMQGQHISFNTETGEVFVRTLPGPRAVASEVREIRDRRRVL
jgi:chemotaxis protein CheD